MNTILTVDIGSTYTKLTAVDLQKPGILATSAAFTTIRTDVRDGYEKALHQLRESCGNLEFQGRLAASSAAGGLQMISVGLVPSLTTSAAKTAAASAGAKVVKTYSYELGSREQEQIAELDPDIILLSGGIDGGNKKVITSNAKVLAGIDRDFSVIVAGNKSAADEVAALILDSGKLAVICENVMPEFNQLNLRPAQNAIRDLFMEKIIEAKGLHRLQEIMLDPILPTPLAVFEGLTLLANGHGSDPGFGELLAFDIGGATTDVYSCAEGTPSSGNVIIKDLKEPYAKRSVEADVGMRYSLPHLIEEVGIERITTDLELSEQTVRDWSQRCGENPGILPGKNDPGLRIDAFLAKCAIEISTNRHVGTHQSVYTAMGETLIQRGKDLTRLERIIGTGGVVVHAVNPEKILEGSLYQNEKPEILKPKKARFYLDRKNILTSMGLLSRRFPETALRIMKEEITELHGENAVNP